MAIWRSESRSWLLKHHNNITRHVKNAKKYILNCITKGVKTVRHLMFALRCRIVVHVLKKNLALCTRL